MTKINAHSEEPDENVSELTQARDRPLVESTVFETISLLLRNDELLVAEAKCREAVESRPDSYHFRAALGNLLLIDGRFDDAIEQFQAALDANPDSPAALLDLDRARKTTERPDQLRTQVRAAIAAWQALGSGPIVPEMTFGDLTGLDP